MGSERQYFQVRENIRDSPKLNAWRDFSLEKGFDTALIHVKQFILKLNLVC